MQAEDIITLFEHAPTPVFIIDEHANIHSANPAGHQLAGTQFPDALQFESFLSCKQIGTILHALELSADQTPPPLQLTINNSTFNFICTPLTTTTNQLHMLLAQNAEVSLARQHLEQTDQKMRAMAKLANRIAHDMNNVLSSTLGFSSYLKTQVEPGSDIQKQLGLIEISAVQGHKITQRLLDFSRRRPEHQDQVDLAGILQELALNVGMQKDISIHLTGGMDLPLLAGHPEKIRKALSHILINACEASAQNGADHFHVQLTHMHLSLLERYRLKREHDERSYIHISVTDHGCGIPEDIHPRIVEPYISTKTADVSAGLGLAAAYSMISDHEGIILIKRIPKGGTCVDLYFPVREPAPSARSVVTPLPGTTETLQGSEHILVIDDELIIRQMMSSTLSHFGYTVTCATCGKAGLALYTAAEKPISLIILDLHMAGLSGVETYDMLRTTDAQIPVIIISGYIPPELQTLLDTKKIAAFIHKPFKNIDLLLQIRKTLDSQTGEKHA